jgi:hypothetical protein
VSVSAIVEPSSTRALLAGNLLTLVLAALLKWPLAVVLWPYWTQSVVIGYFSRKRMLALDDFSTSGMSMGEDGTPVPENEEGKRRTAGFFTLHYGFFHLGYAVFLFGFARGLDALDWLGIVASAIGFAWSHKLSFDRNIEADVAVRHNLGKLMVLPYLRIVPMHLAILLGAGLMQDPAQGGQGMALLVFMLLKTGADIAMHYAEHRILRPAVKTGASRS